QGDVGLERLGHGQRGGGVGGDGRLVPLPLEELLHGRGDHLLVVDDQHPPPRRDAGPVFLDDGPWGRGAGHEASSVISAGPATTPPSSSIRRTTRPPCSRASRWIRPPRSVASIAFRTRFRTTCVAWSRTARTGGRSSGTSVVIALPLVLW